MTNFADRKWDPRASKSSTHEVFNRTNDCWEFKTKQSKMAETEDFLQVYLHHD